MSDTAPNTDPVTTQNKSPPSNQSSNNTIVILVGAIIFILVAIVSWRLVDYLLFRNQPTSPEATTPTEVIFVNRIAATDKDKEWLVSREDHKRIAASIASCLGYTDFDQMSRAVFGVLLLDLNLSGQHKFPPQTRSEKNDQTSDVMDTRKPGDKIDLFGSQPEILALSDVVARARLDAAKTAEEARPGMTYYGVAAVLFTGLTTLLISVKPLIGEGWKVTAWIVTFLTLAVSVSSTALTSVKTIYDPSQAYSANTQALIKLRSLHRDMIIASIAAYTPNGCVAQASDPRKDLTPSKELAGWEKRLKEIEEAVTAATVVVPNVPQALVPSNTTNISPAPDQSHDTTNSGPSAPGTTPNPVRQKGK